MGSEKDQILNEIFRDMIFVILVIVATIFASIYLFPSVSKVNVTSSHEYICQNKSLCDCESDEKYCICKYCVGEACTDVKEEKCEK